MIWFQQSMERRPASIQEVAPVVPLFDEITGDPGAGYQR